MAENICGEYKRWVMSEEVNVREDILKLIQLQGIDSGIFDLEEQKNSFPKQIEEMDESLESKKGGMEESDAEVKSLKVSKNDKEIEMKAKEEKIAKHESELYQIKNNKEYQALVKEIGGIKADVSLLEEDILRLFDKIEDAQKMFENEKTIFDNEKQRVEEEKNKIKASEKELFQKIDGMKKEREEIINVISQETYNQYAVILKNRGRVALAKVNDGFCSACCMQLLPQVVNEAQIKKKITYCNYCARMIYADD